MFSLENQVVLVTGSSSGIGAAIARAVHQLGGRAVLNSARSVSAGEELATELEGSLYVQADISREEDRQRLIERALQHFGRLDHLVNNAGTTVEIPHAELEALTPEIWQRIFDVNLFGTYQLTLLALDALRSHSWHSTLCARSAVRW